MTDIGRVSPVPPAIVPRGRAWCERCEKMMAVKVKGSQEFHNRAERYGIACTNWYVCAQCGATVGPPSRVVTK